MRLLEGVALEGSLNSCTPAIDTLRDRPQDKAKLNAQSACGETDASKEPGWPEAAQ